MDSNVLELLWKSPPSRFREGKRIARLMGRASRDFCQIEPGDRILIAVSGGKDSYTLAWGLKQIEAQVPFDIELIAFNIDPGFGGFQQQTVSDCLKIMGHRVETVVENSGSICDDKIKEGESACWLCARLRRGVLYSQARRLGCNKIALGHHADDIVETLFLNQMWAGQLKAMPPWLLNDEKDLIVIRPLAYVWEKTIIEFAANMQFPIVSCNCPYESGLTDSRREYVKNLLNDLSKTVPDVKEHVLASLTRVRPSHLLDRDLYPFGSLDNDE